MKTSTILKEVLRRFVENYDYDMPGICEKLSREVCLLCEGGRKEQISFYNSAMTYVKKYKPSDAGLYWWDLDNTTERIRVLELAISDAILDEDYEIIADL